MDRNNNFRNSLKTPITLLKILGVWRTANSKMYWLYTLFIFCAIQIPTVILPATDLIVDRDVSIVRIAKCIFLNAQTATVPFKTAFFAVSHKKLLEALEILDSEYFKSYTQDHLGIIEEGAAVIRKSSHYITLCFFTVLMIAASPIAYWKERQLFADMWLPFDPKNNWHYYVLAHIYSTAGLMVSALINASLVALACGLIIHGTTQVKILKYTLANLTEGRTERETYSNISQCAAHYAAINNYVKLVGSALSLVLGIQFLSCTIVICLSSFLLTVTPLHEFSFVVIVFYLCCIILETFLVCHFGQHLQTESLTICDAAYFSPWQNFDRKCKKSLLILMEKAKVPLQIAPAGMFLLSNVTFTKLVQRAYSLFTVLQNLDVKVD